jgi:hypothetical protein
MKSKRPKLTNRIIGKGRVLTKGNMHVTLVLAKKKANFGGEKWTI